MSSIHYPGYERAIFLDAEYRQPNGCRVRAVHALVAFDAISGQWWEFDGEQLAAMKESPLPDDPQTLYIGFSLSAEWGAYRRLGWKIPKHAVDLFYEFRRWRNGNTDLNELFEDAHKASLLTALRMFGVTTTTDSAHKERMRQLCIDNDVIPAEYKSDVVAYCKEDVRPLVELFHRILPTAGPFQQVLLRGRWAEVESLISYNGLPMDVEKIDALKERMPVFLAEKVAEINGKYGFFLPSGEVSQKDFARWLIERDLAWPRTASGQLATDAETFGKMAKQIEELTTAYAFVRQKTTLAGVDRLAIGDDGRCRYYQNVFGSVTGRHTAKLNPFGLPKWVRSLILPREGMAYITADWSSQEIGIAAYLSNDPAMKELFAAAVRGDDVYMTFGIMAGLMPKGAQREDYEQMRARCKTTLLGANYGAGAGTIAEKLGISKGEAHRLLMKYNELFAVYGRWGQDVIDYGTQFGELQTMSGWRRKVGRNPKHPVGAPNVRALINWPIQATGADLMRAATLLCCEAGLQVVATIHDAICIESTADQADDAAHQLQTIMAKVCLELLGMPARSDVSITRYPDRYRDSEKPKAWEDAAAEIGVEP